MAEDARARTACADTPGRVTPVIDRGRCEAKGGCVTACPFNVFEIRALSREEFAALPLLGKLKAWAHGKRQAFAVRADACHACGACVKACPEGAIRLSPAHAGDVPMRSS